MTTLLQQLKELAPEGFGFGAHIRFAAPLYQRSAYPEAWRELYGRQNYALRDPMMFWAIANSGAIRWSEIEMPDPFSVLEKARAYGLNFGVVISCGPITSRTVLGLASSLREFTGDEMTWATSIALEIHRVTEPVASLPPELDAARRADALGVSPSEAAAEMDIPPAAYLTRLARARDMAGAGSPAGASGIP
ncbi:Autoinducer binding domain protein [Jannaschia seosinensis]|uniref:Autoinducer binding domain protein n=2 Tax=Jannaschia seosinensis TaxID=313367 RepID=A0A0M7BI17_9RHOB|nr:Autoinducer binding domain protein [Jannaschia seosinensis]